MKVGIFGKEKTKSQLSVGIYLYDSLTRQDKSSSLISSDSADNAYTLFLNSSARIVGIAIATQILRRGNRRRRWVLQPVGCDRRDASVSHTCGVATLSMIRCGKRVGSTCARAKLRNYRRSADLLLGRYTAAFAHAREREREKKKDREQSAWKVTREIAMTISLARPRDTYRTQRK